MNKFVCLALAGLGIMLAGCSTAPPPVGCTGLACSRPDSTDRSLVIWWPEEMRHGLEGPERVLDFTVVPLKD
ncbi:HrpT family type III secretion system protein [Pseudomonas gingeri]|uniref:Type III secretion protein n=1 Tax=Pseudomonas gingeri TaxID=117681 RepID=A0A7Y7Y9K7_9PSED|nr:type III secretion protein [Pseudomonas gingeri]NWA18136.1 type III secretion protein [Pseudomonas gingeri]NWA56283.1 type III secretion protein [Pseudomonas gingeri]NWA98861.1 type III secretion protein [Pseudomonas gingeri]NWB04820.1 type III secretion protein [Pseudomonas gingeri]